MSSVYGEKLKVSLFGQSHSDAIGVVIDGLPSGIKIDMQELQSFLLRRAARDAFSTQRQEPDVPEFLSGLKEDTTCGAPVCAIIKNTNVRKNDYNNILTVPRPSHADYASFCKTNGASDLSGGGHLSGRLTAALCIAGGICIQYLKKLGITVGAHIYSIYDVSDTPFDGVNITADELNAINKKPFPVINDENAEKMKTRIMQAKESLDSVGGIIEFAALGLKPGIGSPHFGGLENRISMAMFGIPAVKGIEFGNGFGCAALTGSQNNDAFYIDPEKNIRTKTNNSGGINGGMSNGMPVYGRVVIKPTPSIAKEQESVDLSTMENTKLIIKGRHDPCIVHRAVPCIISAVTIALCDAILCDKL